MKIALLLDVIIPSASAESIAAMRMADAMAELGHDVELIHAETATRDHSASTSLRAHYSIAQAFKMHGIERMCHSDADRYWADDAIAAAMESGPDLVYTRSMAAAFLAVQGGFKTILECHRDIGRPKQRYVSWKKRMKWYAGLIALAGRRVALSLTFRHEELSCFPRLSAGWRLVRSHGLDTKSRLFDQLLGHACLLKVIVITRPIKDALVENFALAPCHVRVVPDAALIPSSTLTPASLGGREQAVRVGYCGHLYPGKGMEIIAAVAPLCPELDFHIVGGTPDDLQLWEDRLSDIANVVFHGRVTPALTARYLKAFDICLLPNQEKVATHGNPNDDIGRFTSPLKMFEYMAAGKPIIASDLPVLREVLVHDRNAILCPHDDPAAWAKQLTRLADDPDRRALLGRRAYAECVKNYTWLARARAVLAA